MDKEELLGLIQTGEGYTLDFKESLPSDLGRIRKAMGEYGLKAKFDISEGWFSVMFPRAAQAATPQATPQDRLTALELKILGEIKRDARISRNAISGRLKISPDTVKTWKSSKPKTPSAGWGRQAAGTGK